VAVKETPATGIEFDQHISGVGRDVDVQNSVVTAFGKEVLPFDLAGIKAKACGFGLLQLSGRGAVHCFFPLRWIA
jgi:hypothetical protein